MDYNLFGMSYIRLSAVKFRHPLPVSSPDSEQQQPLKLTVLTAPKDLVWPFDHQLSEKSSNCELEADCQAENIINRREKETRRSQPDGATNQIVSSLAEIWEDELKRRRAKDPQAEIPRTLSQERQVPPTAFDHEERWKTRLLEMIQGCAPSSPAPQPQPQPLDQLSPPASAVGSQISQGGSLYRRQSSGAMVDVELISLTQQELEREDLANEAAHELGHPPADLEEADSDLEYLDVLEGEEEEEEDLEDLENQILQANQASQEDFGAAPNPQEDRDTMMPDIEDLVMRKHSEVQLAAQLDIPQFDGGVDDDDLPPKPPSAKKKVPRKSRRDLNELVFEDSRDRLKEQRNRFDANSKSGFGFLTASEKASTPPPPPQPLQHGLKSQRSTSPELVSSATWRLEARTRPPVGSDDAIDFTAWSLEGASDDDADRDEATRLNARRSFRRMWSPTPRQPEPLRPSFFFDPPRPTSPSFEPGHPPAPTPAPTLPKPHPFAPPRNMGVLDDDPAWNLSPLSSVADHIIPETASNHSGSSPSKSKFFKSKRRRLSVESKEKDLVVSTHQELTRQTETRPQEQPEDPLPKKLRLAKHQVPFSSLDSPPLSPVTRALGTYHLNSTEKLHLEETVSSVPPLPQAPTAVPTAAFKNNPFVFHDDGEFNLSPPAPLSGLEGDDFDMVPESLSPKRKRAVPEETRGPNHRQQRHFQYLQPPPSSKELLTSLAAHNLRAVVYADPSYSNPKDIPPRPLNFGGREIAHKSHETKNLPPFQPPGSVISPFFAQPKGYARLFNFLKLSLLTPNSSLSSAPPRVQHLASNVFCPVEAPISKDKVLPWLESFLPTKPKTAIKVQDKGEPIFCCFFFPHPAMFLPLLCHSPPPRFIFHRRPRRLGSMTWLIQFILSFISLFYCRCQTRSPLSSRRPPHLPSIHRIHRRHDFPF